MTNAINPTTLFCSQYILSQNKTDSILPSSLEVAFLSDSGASISVHSVPTYLMITQMISACRLDQH